MSKSELPSVTIEGAEHSLCIRYKKTPVGGTAAGSPWIQHDPATEEHLAAMLAALAAEQLLRVLEATGLTLPAKLRALQRELEQERAKFAKLDEYARGLLEEKDREAHYRMQFSGELEQERQRSADYDGRRREARMLLSRMVRYARKDAQHPRFTGLVDKVSDYLNRTSDPRDILRAKKPDGQGAR